MCTSRCLTPESIDPMYLLLCHFLLLSSADSWLVSQLSAVCIKPSVCGSVGLSVTLNGVTNCNRWTQRSEILYTETYWSPVARDQKLGLPWPTLLGFQGIVENALNAYICIISASNWPVVTKFAPWVHLTGMQQLPGIWPTFRSQRGHNGQKTFWDNQGGTNRNHCTQTLVVLRVMTH